MAESRYPIPDHLADIVKTVQAVRAALPPFVTELARIGAQVRELALPAIESITAAQQALALALPPQGQIVELLRQIQEGSRWVHEAPKALQAALAGRTVVHQELSFPDIAAIIRAFEERGEDAAVAKVQELHQRLLNDEALRERFRARWEAAGRWAVMNDVLAAYDAGLYYASIPPALAQTEGLVADFFGLSNLKLSDLKWRVQELHEGELFEPVVTSFLEALLVPFDHQKPVPQLNRHAVQHGGDKAYGTKANAVAAIIWADYLLGVTIEAREKREAASPPDAADPAHFDDSEP